jgi:hypothetical protein
MVMVVDNVELKSSTRLYAILAREAPVAVVFRRGPSKQVLLSLWRTDIDKFTDGQWFKGRIYERRCDLSPSGRLLIYLAAKYKEPHAWTAVSKPPFLTALAMWAKQDTWGGGGLFTRENEILLNHREDEKALSEGFELPGSVTVKPLGEYSGRGEDSPILARRMSRDGWRLIQEGTWTENKLDAPVWIEYQSPQIWSKTNARNSRYQLIYQLVGVHERDGPSYLTDHMVRDTKTGSELNLGRSDWADWGRDGDLVFAKEGRILRLGFHQQALDGLEQACVVRDFTDCTFEARQSPPEARLWSL